MNVRAELVEIISEYVEIPAEVINTSESLKLGIGLDSFATLSLISSIEEHFNIAIPDDKLQQFKTLDDIIAYVESVV